MKTREIQDREAMLAFGQTLGRILRGGEVIELVGDVGAGKTTLVKGLAVGLGIDEDVQSPTFTISRVYPARDGLELAHYDFYRLSDPGIIAMEVAERVSDSQSITVIEWAESIADVLPKDRLTLRITSPTEETRHIELRGRDELVEELV